MKITKKELEKQIKTLEKKLEKKEETIEKLRAKEFECENYAFLFSVDKMSAPYAKEIKDKTIRKKIIHLAYEDRREVCETREFPDKNKVVFVYDNGKDGLVFKFAEFYRKIKL